MDRKEEHRVFDLTPFVAKAISSKRFHKDIDKIYKTNELQFYINSKKSKYYNMYSSGSALQLLYYRKALGILSSEIKDDKIIFDILKKGYKYEYNYVNNSKIVRLSDYAQKMMKKCNNSTTINNFNDKITVLLMFCSYKDILIDTKDVFFIEIMKGMNYILEFEKDNKYKINYNEAPQEFKNIVFKEFKRLKKEDPLLLYEGAKEKKDRSKESDNNISAIEFIFDIFNISINDLVEDNLLSDNELMSILFCYFVTHNKKFDNSEKLKIWLEYSLKISYLLKAYNEAKEYILNNNNEKLLLKIEELENNNNNVNNKLGIINNKFKMLEKENKELQKENTRLKLELEKLNKDKKEINSLREYIFDSSNNIHIEETNFNFETAINKLINMNVVIIGGSLNWINKIKEILPNWTYIPTGSNNFDTKLLENKYILFNTDYVNHSMYYRTTENIGKAKKFNFFSGSSNVNLSIKKNI